MRMAAVIYKKGAPDNFVWEEIKVGSPGRGQVRLRSTAVGVNFADTYHRAGIPHPMIVGDPPVVLGFEPLAGSVLWTQAGRLPSIPQLRVLQTDRRHAVTSHLTQLYGPAVRCELNLQSGSDWSCASVSGPCVEQIAPGHHGYPHASDLILG